MSRYQVVPLTFSVFAAGDNPVFGESATHITIDDHAAGPFLVLRQSHDELVAGEIRLDFEELDLIASTAKNMLTQYKGIVSDVDQNSASDDN